MLLQSFMGRWAFYYLLTRQYTTGANGDTTGQAYYWRARKTIGCSQSSSFSFEGWSWCTQFSWSWRVSFSAGWWLWAPYSHTHTHTHTLYSCRLMAVPPTDPVLYRLYEMIQVYGYPIKAVIHEKVWIFIRLTWYVLTRTSLEMGSCLPLILVQRLTR